MSEENKGFSLRPSDVNYMPPLLQALSTIMRLKGKIVSPQLLLSGLAGNTVSPGACLAAARKAGLMGTIVKRKLNEISALVLPCILLLKNNKACVLVSTHKGRAEIVLPEIGDTTTSVSLQELAEDYTGYAIFASIPMASEKRISAPKITSGKRWFWDVIKHYAPIYRHVAIASVVINLIAVASPLFVMNVYDRVVPNAATDTLWVLASGIIVIYMFNFLISSLRAHFVDVAGRNADVVLSSILVGKLLSIRLDSKPESTGALVNNLREFEQLREFFSSSSLLACIDLPFLFIFLILLGFIAGPIIFVPMAAIPVLFFAGYILQRLSARSVERSYKQNMQKNALLVEIVNGLETLKACMAESRMLRLWEAVSGASADTASITKRYNHLAVAFSMFVTQMVTVILIIWGVYRIGDGLMSMGALIGANILAGRVMAPLMQMASLLARIQNSRISLKALDMLMELPVEDDVSKAHVDFGKVEPSITLENVSFTYPGAEKESLSNINLHISPGEKIGIIGQMGSGKTSLMRMILGLYLPKEGSVKFGGVDIRQMPSADLRSRIGAMPQEVVLFYGTIRENISLGDPSIDNGMIIRASTLAGILDFIKDNPAGFAAQVGEQGKNLSGGQRQAVALARALVRDPEILILDEPTSNMDVTSEHKLQQNLLAVSGDRTLILMTHRMSLLKIVDRIIVLDKGRIVMDGPRDAVLEKLSAK